MSMGTEGLKLRLVLVVGGLALAFGGCATLSRQQCEAGDWKTY
jgi:hypothetical protein